MQPNLHASNHPARIGPAERKPNIGKHTDGSEAGSRSPYKDSSNRSGDRLVKWRPSRAPTPTPTHNNARQSR
jgi:hypothetical protein